MFNVSQHIILEFNIKKELGINLNIGLNFCSVCILYGLIISYICLGSAPL